MIHISPETNGTGEILPHALVLPDRLLALLDKGLDAVLLDLVFAVQSKLLLDTDLNGKSVGVPAGLARNEIALHGLIPGDHVLDHTG